jgi:hypothetical protein
MSPNGIMEYWNVGKMGDEIRMSYFLLLKSIPIRLKPIIPIFHYSNIPE